MNNAAEKVDAVIVGAGAAGAFYARHLAQAGKSVVVLEAGPAWEMKDLASSQIWARRLRFSGAPVTSTGANPFGYDFNAGWGYGGSALHHYGTWPRMHEEDFVSRSLYGRSLDWPFDYHELRPYYDRIQAEAGISGDEKAEVWRPPGDPYPMPPLSTFGQAQLIAKGFAAVGLRTAPMPMAITSRPYQGRPACLYDGWCDAGCPIGALYNPLVRDVPQARAAGARFLAQCTVTRVLTENGRAVAVEYCGRDGELQRQPADVVILAASAVHNPSILLNSASDAMPHGLANSSGLVGRYFMTHVMTGIYGLFDEQTQPHMGVSGAQLTCRDDYSKHGDKHGFASLQWLIAPSMKPNDLLGIAVSRTDLFGPALDRFVRRGVRHIGNMIAMVEDLPDADNRVELTAERDRFGRRGIKVVHRFSTESLAVREFARKQGLQVMAAAGADEPWAGPIGTAHMMGGTIMGDDPANSVTDSYGRCHDVPNLVVAGTGLFPTSGAVNPTYTMYALSLRAVEHVKAHWSGYAG